jgi:hypothetical protein
MNMEYPPGPQQKKDDATEAPVEKNALTDTGNGRRLRNFGRALLFGLGATAAAENSTAATVHTEPSEGYELRTATAEQKLPEHTADFSTGFAKDTTGAERHGLKLYTESKTPEGAITPTGYNNSFYENEQGLSLEEVLEFAKEEHLPVDDNQTFQKALEEKYPDIVKNVMEKYGQTNAGAFADNLLGVRVKEVMEAVREQHKTPEVSVKTPEKTPKVVHVKDGYVLNVRGDDKAGAYYFFDNKADFEAFLKLAHVPNTAGTEGENYGQITFDMTDAVFREYHAGGEAGKMLIGRQIKRNPADYTTFVHVEDATHAAPMHDVAQN